jgi:hypothetical protein
VTGLQLGVQPSTLHISNDQRIMLEHTRKAILSMQSFYVISFRTSNCFLPPDRYTNNKLIRNIGSTVLLFGQSSGLLTRNFAGVESNLVAHEECVSICKVGGVGVSPSRDPDMSGECSSKSRHSHHG